MYRPVQEIELGDGVWLREYYQLQTD